MPQLPENWKVEAFAEIADYATGRTPARNEAAYWNESAAIFPWVSISDMEEYGTVIDTSERVTVAASEKVFRGRIVPAGTLLMSFKLTIGRIATLGVPAFHNEAIISIYPRAGVDQRYLGYFLSQVDYCDHQDRQVKGQTLNQSKIDRIPVVLPPIGEQGKIADVLDAVRVGIKFQERLESASTELKRAAMRELFTRGLRGEPQKETEIGPLPESWEVVQLGSLGKIGNGTTPNRRQDRYWQGGTIPWITSGMMYEREITDSKSRVTHAALDECSLPLLQPGAVLMAIVGQGKTLGHCAILGIEATASRHVGFIQPKIDVVSPRFLRGYLESQYGYLRQLASGNGSTRGALTGAILKGLCIPLPSFDEQREVVAILDAIDRKIDLHKRKSAVLEELFQALLHKLMAGEIRVTDLDLSALQPAEGVAP